MPTSDGYTVSGEGDEPDDPPRSCIGGLPLPWLGDLRDGGALPGLPSLAAWSLLIVLRNGGSKALAYDVRAGTGAAVLVTAALFLLSGV